MASEITVHRNTGKIKQETKHVEEKGEKEGKSISFTWNNKERAK